MNTPRVATLLGILLASPLLAQVEIPANPVAKPGKTTARSIGGGTDSGVSIVPAKPDQRYVTHIVLSESRLWTSNDGKPLEAKLVAFEDLVAQAPQGSSEPVMPSPPAHPTVVRDGKRAFAGEQEACHSGAGASERGGPGVRRESEGLARPESRCREIIRPAKIC